jgi:hypothetical protein
MGVVIAGFIIFVFVYSHYTPYEQKVEEKDSTDRIFYGRPQM